MALATTFPSSKPCILTLDGGGVRGLVPALLLVELEKILQEESKDPDARIFEYFDLVAGTSAGALLAAMLAAPPVGPANHGKKVRYTAEEILDAYLNCVKEIFPPPSTSWKRWWRWVFWGPKWAVGPLENLLKSYFHGGKQGHLRLSETLVPVFMPSYSVTKQECQYFSTMQAKNSLDGLRDHELWQVCRATTAAPTYFPPMSLSTRSTNPGVTEVFERDGLVDGGLFANNPTAAAVTHVKIFSELDAAAEPPKAPPKVSDMLILSIGSGQSPAANTMKELMGWSAWKWIVGPLFNAMMGSNQIQTEVDVSCHNWAENLAEGTVDPTNYLRFQLTGLAAEQAGIDDASDENVSALAAAVKAFIQGPMWRRDWSAVAAKPGGIAMGPPLIRDKRSVLQVLREFGKKLVEARKVKTGTPTSG